MNLSWNTILKSLGIPETIECSYCYGRKTNSRGDYCLHCGGTGKQTVQR